MEQERFKSISKTHLRKIGADKSLLHTNPYRDRYQ